MEQLFLRTEVGRELTWEELDTNWLRIKNGVDALEVQLQHTREQRDWVLPLYFLGSPDSDHYIRLVTKEIEGISIGCIEEMHPDYNVINSHFGLIGLSNNYKCVANYSVIGSQANYDISVERLSPYTGMGIYVSADEVSIISHLAFAWRAENVGSNLQMGFFGAIASQQSITESSADAAITQIQNILIAYGLALDNRS